MVLLDTGTSESQCYKAIEGADLIGLSVQERLAGPRQLIDTLPPCKIEKGDLDKFQLVV